MKTAAETYDQLMTLLNPQFEAFTSAIKDLKKDLGDINDKLQEIHDKAVVTADTVSHLEKRSDDHELRIKDLENTSRDNLNGVKDYKRFKAIALGAIGASVGILTSLLTWGISAYLENARHEEEMEIKRQENAQYQALNDKIEKLKKSMGDKQ